MFDVFSFRLFQAIVMPLLSITVFVGNDMLMVQTQRINLPYMMLFVPVPFLLLGFVLCSKRNLDSVVLSLSKAAALLCASDVMEQVLRDADVLDAHLPWQNERQFVLLLLVALKFLAKSRQAYVDGKCNVLNLQILDRGGARLPGYAVCEHRGDLDQGLVDDPELAVIAFAHDEARMGDAVVRAVQAAPLRVLNWNKVARLAGRQMHLMFMAASTLNIVILPSNVLYSTARPRTQSDLQMTELKPRTSMHTFSWYNEINAYVGAMKAKVFTDLLANVLKPHLKFTGKPDSFVTEFTPDNADNNGNMLQLISGVLARMDARFKGLAQGKLGTALRFRTLHMLLILNQANEGVRGLLQKYLAQDMSERGLIYALQMAWHEKKLGALVVTGVDDKPDWFNYLNFAMMLQVISGIQVIFDSNALRSVQFRKIGNEKSSFLFASER